MSLGRSTGGTSSRAPAHTPLRVTAAACVLALAALVGPHPAHAETWWTAEEEDEVFIPRIRLAPHIGFWVGEFDRTSRGCDPDYDPGFGFAEDFPTVQPEQQQQVAEIFCPTEGSDELALSAGVSAVYRVLGPVHLSVGLDLALTFPDREALQGQFIIAVPISVGLTHDPWTFRPIVNATLMPYFSAPDLRRGFTYGGEWGFAWRVPDLAEIQLTAGYHASSDWGMGIVRVSGYIP